MEQAVEPSAQQRFDEKYITSAEVCKTMGVCRTTVLSARKRGLLPDAVMVNEVVLVWERATVEPFLKAWKLVLDTRRAHAVA